MDHLKSIQIIFYTMCALCFHNTMSGPTYGTIVKLNTFDQTTSNSRCRSGLIAGQDILHLTGTIDTSRSSTAKRSNAFFTYKRPNENYDNVICQVDFTKVCTPIMATEDCYCAANSSSILTLVMKVRALKDYSQSQIQLSWPDATQTNEDKSVYIQAPEMFDQESISLKIDQRDIYTETNIQLSVGAHTLHTCISNLISLITLTDRAQQVQNIPKGPVCFDYQFQYMDNDYGRTLNICYTEQTSCRRQQCFKKTLINEPQKPAQEFRDTTRNLSNSLTLTMSLLIATQVLLLLLNYI